MNLDFHEYYRVTTSPRYYTRGAVIVDEMVQKARSNDDHELARNIEFLGGLERYMEIRALIGLSVSGESILVDPGLQGTIKAHGVITALREATSAASLTGNPARESIHNFMQKLADVLS